MNPGEAVVSLEHITHRRQGAAVLADLSYSFVPGGIYGIVGPNGAGKTSLLRLLALLEKPAVGRLIFQGTDVTGTWPEVLAARRQIGMVAQQPLLFTGTVAANVALPLKFRHQPRTQVRRRVQELLAAFRLGELAHRPVSRLSGGEAQKVALARAVAADPALLLLDEPTASLDPRNTLEFETQLRDLHRQNNPTIVMVTHDLGQAERLTQELLFLHQGRLVEAGPTDKLLTRPENDYTRLFVARQLLV